MSCVLLVNIDASKECGRDTQKNLLSVGGVTYDQINARYIRLMIHILKTFKIVSRCVVF